MAFQISDWSDRKSHFLVSKLPILALQLWEGYRRIIQPKFPNNWIKIKNIGQRDGFKICLYKLPMFYNAFKKMKFSLRTYHHSFCHLHSKSIPPYSSRNDNQLHSYRSVRIRHCSFHTHLHLCLKM